jgi:YgiT-type zinc finger domain-containing protein
MTCVICKHGETREGTTAVTCDRDGMTLVVNDLPARICTNCGEDCVDEHDIHEFLAIAERMAGGGTPVNVRRYGSGSAMPCWVFSFFNYLDGPAHSGSCDTHGFAGSMKVPAVN